MRKAKVRLTPLERTAYHEAGHVVANYLVGFKMEDVSIVPDKESLGHVTCNPFKDYDFDSYRIYHIKDYELIFNTVLKNMAGDISECKAAGKRKLFVNRDDDDCSLTLFTACEISGRLKSSIIEAAECYIWEIFDEERPWELVQLIARTLLERKTLTGREILEIIENSDYRILRKTLNRPS